MSTNCADEVCNTATTGSVQRPVEMELERQVTMAPSIANCFVPNFLSKSSRTTNNDNSQMEAESPSIWVSAFQERSRFVTDFDMIDTVGQGTFSVVFAMRNRLDGMLCAVKRIEEKIHTQNQRKRIVKESSALAIMRGCPSIIQYFGCWEEEKQLYIQTELCNLGNIEDFISLHPSTNSAMHVKRKHQLRRNSQSLDNILRSEHLAYKNIGGSSSVQDQTVHSASSSEQKPRAIPVKEELAWKILESMTEALLAMHERKMVHLDIRPANIFVTEALPNLLTIGLTKCAANDFDGLSYAEKREKCENNIITGRYLMKLGDFGHCCRAQDFSTERNSWTSHVVSMIDEGETRYCARELITTDDISSVDLYKADVFSLGASVYECCLGRSLLTTESGNEQEPTIVSSRDNFETDGISMFDDDSHCDNTFAYQDIQFVGTGEWHDIRNGKLSAEFEQTYSSALVALVRSMLSATPDARPTAKQLQLQVMQRQQSLQIQRYQQELHQFGRSITDNTQGFNNKLNCSATSSNTYGGETSFESLSRSNLPVVLGQNNSCKKRGFSQNFFQPIAPTKLPPMATTAVTKLEMNSSARLKLGMKSRVGSCSSLSCSNGSSDDDYALNYTFNNKKTKQESK